MLDSELYMGKNEFKMTTVKEKGPSRGDQGRHSGRACSAESAELCTVGRPWEPRYLFLSFWQRLLWARRHF